MVIPQSLFISRHIGFQEHELVKHKNVSGHIENVCIDTGLILHIFKVMKTKGHKSNAEGRICWKWIIS